MFRLMDRVSDGIAPMLKCLEDHIVHAGLADMMVAAELITQVGIFYRNVFLKSLKWFIFFFRIRRNMSNDF